MQKTIDETNYRRTKQINFNTENNVIPMALNKKIESAFTKNPLVDYELGHTTSMAAEPITEYLSKPEIEKKIREKRKAMEKAAKDLDFMQAAKLRDEIKTLQQQL
jgi:excinuclease ABC subunit B